MAIVTGGAQRIGSAIALHLHERGYDIALHYRSSVESARALAKKMCSARTDSCVLCSADLGEPAQIEAMVSELLQCYPAVDLLVNNASGFEATPIDSASAAEFDAMLDSNLKGPYFLVQSLLPALRTAGGSIVNILDVHVERPLPGFNAYVAAKAGLASLTRSLAVELGPTVRVNGIAPGAILWPEGEEAYDAATRERTIESTPLKRLGEPQDIARTVAFLADDAPFITGQVISVDGGRGLVG